MTEHALLITAVAAVWIAALIAQRASKRANVELEWLTSNRADQHTAALPPNALELRLAPELQWAAATERQVGVATFRFLGVDPDEAARLLRRYMRGSEVAYQVRLDEFAIAFWDSDRTATHRAITRLGSTMDLHGAQLVEVGSSVFPEDGTSYEELLTSARDRRAVLEFADTDEPHYSTVPVALRPLAAAAPGFVAAAALAVLLRVLASWWGTWEVGQSGAMGTLAALGIAVVVGALGAGCTWLSVGAPSFHLPLTNRAAPASEGWIVGTGLVIGAAAALGLLLDSPAAMTLATLAVVVTGLQSARALVHAQYLVLALLIAVGVGMVLLTRGGPVDAANTGRLLVAAAAGCGVARALERWTWSVWIMIAAAALDTWSVFSEHGVTRELATAGSAITAAATRSISDPLSLDDLLYVGPPVDATPAFQLGTSDLVLVTMCIATAHVWRLGTRTVAAAMVLGVIAAVGVSILRGDIAPAIPLLAVAYLGALATARFGHADAPR